MEWSRSDRLAEAIRVEMSEIIEYELNDERISDTVVTDVKISQDLRNATIFVNINGDKSKVKETLNALQRAGGFIRYQMANRLQMNRIPEFSFKYDDTQQKAARIEQLLGEEMKKESET